MLRTMVEDYLRAKGCSSYQAGDKTMWAHPELGSGRTFDMVVDWWMAKEDQQPRTVGRSDAPMCNSCGDFMQRAGSCYVCASCGSTSGCS